MDGCIARVRYTLGIYAKVYSTQELIRRIEGIPAVVAGD